MLKKYLSCPTLLAAASTIDVAQMHEYLRYLEDKGYACGTIHSYLGAVVHFEHWRCVASNVLMTGIQNESIVFLDQHLPQCQCPRSFQRNRTIARAAIKHWIQLTPSTNIDDNNQPAHSNLIASYDNYLKEVVGLSASTRRKRRRHALEFLDWFFDQYSLMLEQLSSKHINHYVTEIASTKSSVIAADVVTSMRSLAQFLGGQGYCSADCYHTILRPKISYQIPSALTLNEDELSRLLGAINRADPVGKRDYAMARCLIDLGIRTSDVAGVNLDRIDWRHGVITLAPGKSKRQRTLPMPFTTTDALVDYLRHGRPLTQERCVFVHHRAPMGQAVLPSTVRQVIRRAFARAGFKPAQSQVHRLRHTMATRLLAHRNPLKTIADLLGHQSLDTTIRYTYVDRSALAAVALPWPGRTES